ncbi:hypothetical protein L210DRAFT_933964 [Boletus edulis BED1]|uniref:Uncharacterized protein n=1 Tax=Boletus edulis BED1 TaxID=1328754 RepID=A0AAD4C5E3_BOLED|nr:hypothetical protein L210DRAFT_933964 [Boletus edulis BED1]
MMLHHGTRVVTDIRPLQFHGIWWTGYALLFYVAITCKYTLKHGTNMWAAWSLALPSMLDAKCGHWAAPACGMQGIQLVLSIVEHESQVITTGVKLGLGESNNLLDIMHKMLKDVLGIKGTDQDLPSIHMGGTHGCYFQGGILHE